MRRPLRALFRRALSIFFRKIEIEGIGRVPAKGPVIFVANHPNALVDPLLLLCFAPRPVSFLAKAPLFAMPGVGALVRAFGSIPVYRRGDPGTDLGKNRETFEAARRLLEKGGSLALFPEGASHDEPRLLPMKSGAARIALGAAAQAGFPLRIVPVNLYYTWKLRFRSSALVTFGDAIEVSAVVLETDGEPPKDAVRALTRDVGAKLGELTLQAETHEALDLVRTAERIFSFEAVSGNEGSLPRELSRRRRIVEGYRQLARRDPKRLAGLEQRISRFDAERRAAGLSLKHLTPDKLSGGSLLRLLAKNLAAVLLLPLAAVGLLIHYPTYRLIGFLARSLSREEKDVVATLKVAAAMLLLPATWLAGFAVVTMLKGFVAGLAVLLLLPLSGWAALRAAESFDELVGRARALLHLTFSGYAVKRLLAERLAIREEMTKIDQELTLAV